MSSNYLGSKRTIIYACSGLVVGGVFGLMINLVMPADRGFVTVVGAAIGMILGAILDVASRYHKEK